MTKEFRIRKSWVAIGAGPFFGLGLYIDRYHFHIDLVCIYLSIEY